MNVVWFPSKVVIDFVFGVRDSCPYRCTAGAAVWPTLRFWSARWGSWQTEPVLWETSTVTHLMTVWEWRTFISPSVLKKNMFSFSIKAHMQLLSVLSTRFQSFIHYYRICNDLTFNVKRVHLVIDLTALFLNTFTVYLIKQMK